MIEIIEGLPADTLGLLIKEKLCAQDYQDILIPAAEKKLAEHSRIKMLIRIEDLDKIELAAMWEDTKFGLKHWHDFSHMALVTDLDWMKSMAAFFAPFVPGEVRIYSIEREGEAQEWLAGLKEAV